AGCFSCRAGRGSTLRSRASPPRPSSIADPKLVRTPRMKRVLIVSLALNLVLAGTVGWFVAHQRNTAPIIAAAVPPPGSPAPKTATSRSHPAGDSTEVRDWLPQLREAGVPDGVLARLVAANYMASWEKRREQMQLRWERGEIDDDDWFQF